MMELEVAVLSAVRIAVSSPNTENFHSALEALEKSCPPPPQKDLYAQLKAQIQYQQELLSAYREIGRVLLKKDLQVRLKEEETDDRLKRLLGLI